MLSTRQETVLRIIVGEYVSTASPVGSAAIVRKYDLGVSPATVRNDMADLEETGFITHPHTSAGRIPSDRGYRHIVDLIDESVLLPESVQRMIREQFQLVDLETEEWSRLAANVLARVLQNAAIVTLPRAASVQLRRLELVQLHTTLAMLVLVLREARVKQQMMALPVPVEPDELRVISNRLNGLIANADLLHISRIVREAELTELERLVLDVTQRTLTALQAPGVDEVRVAGLPDALGQPEFGEGQKAMRLAELLSHPLHVAQAVQNALGDEELSVVIGSEHHDEVMHEYGVVTARYGLPGEMTGVIGLVGPTRLAYDRAIPVVRYLSEMMTQLVREVRGA